MNDSILTTVKKMLGIDSSYEHFDTDIIIHINTAFLILNQMGVGPTTPYVITGANETWYDFFGPKTNYELVKTWMFLKVKSLFDPTASSAIQSSYERALDELEFRMQAELFNDEVNQNGQDN